MYAARGLGDSSDTVASNPYAALVGAGDSSASDSTVATNPYAALVGAGGSTSTDTTSGTNPYYSLLAQFLPVTAGGTSSGTTFSQWVEANSTLLLVLFAGVGAVVALTRVGR